MMDMDMDMDMGMGKPSTELDYLGGDDEANWRLN